jgi:hypothetical protein
MVKAKMPDPHKQLVKEKLEQVGYSVTEIPEEAASSADLAAAGDDIGLIVEVKARRDDIEHARQFLTGPAGRVIGSHEPIVHDDPLSDLVHHAEKQIVSSQRRYPGLGMLWLRAAPELGISHADEKMVTTLLGKRYVNVRGADGIIQPAIPCYLAAYADFFRYPAIDLAIVEDPEDHARLLVNPYSRRLADVRASRLFTVISNATPGAIIDVHRISPPAGYVLFGDFPRRDEAVVLAELKGRYPDRDFQLFDMISSIGRVRLDR